MAEPASSGRGLLTAILLVLLVAVLTTDLAGRVHPRVVALGEGFWPGYTLARVAAIEGQTGPTCAVDRDCQAEADARLARSKDDDSGAPPARDDLVASCVKALEACRAEHADFAARTDSAGPAGVAAVWMWVDRALERLAGSLALTVKPLVVVLVLLGSATATVTRHHIALRPVRTVLDDRVSMVLMAVANLLLAASSWAWWRAQLGSTAEAAAPHLALLWAVGFAVLTVLCLVSLARPARGLAPGGSVGGALLAVPLFVPMALIGGAWFVGWDANLPKLAILLEKLPELAYVYLTVGLYVWAGMMLKQTSLTRLGFDVVRPWGLPPELLAALVVAGAALPTAYSGASGIFVIATGAVVYEELRRSGARGSLAWAATAMSGSLGVVLRPCLIVFAVAALNKEVTTDALYGWGRWVFLLSASFFLVAVVVTRQGPLTPRPAADAAAVSAAAVRRVLPYLGVAAAVVLVWRFALDVRLTENTIPYVLPVVMLAVLAWDRHRARRVDPRAQTASRAVIAATDEASSHIGALMTLMGLTVCLGGVAEESEVMALVPASFGSPAAAMTLLLGVLVVVGMTMDPLGAVILVSSTVARVAADAGIDPVHFWMVVLVAFELGYLSPPVALNQLLTRQVVGADEAARLDRESAGAVGFWRRHERVLLPLSVMVVTLLVVAYGPLLLG